MIVYPAIDISSGRIVRLQKGNFSKKTIYSKDVKSQVKNFEEKGAKWIHVVDLDGALHGKNKNKETIKEILNVTNCKIQLGGGIRTLENIDYWVSLGIERVVIGTAAILEKTLVEQAIKLYPRKISVGLDLLNEKVAIKGWTETTEDYNAEYFFRKFSDLGVESIIYTDISKDGVLKGPNIKNINYYKNISSVPLIASGGVSNLKDLIELKNNGVEGVIVGKAIYDKKIELENIFNLN